MTGNYDHPKLEKSYVGRLLLPLQAIPGSIKTMAVILFEDDKAADLSPAALARPVSTIPCGGYRLDELIHTLDLPVIHAPRSYLCGTVPTGSPETVSDDKTDFHLLLNGRLVPAIATLRYLQDWLANTEPGVLFQEDTLLAAQSYPPAHSNNGTFLLRHF